MKCDFCSKVGTILFLDLNLDNPILQNFDRFETVLVLIPYYNYPDTILRCPVCHTCFMKRITIDNEILYGSDDVEFKEISPELTQELVDYQKKKNHIFAGKIDKLIKTKAADLTQMEEKIMAVFKKKLKEDLSLYGLIEAFEETIAEAKPPAPCTNLVYPGTDTQQEIFKAVIMPSLNSLVEKDILKRYVESDIEHYRIVNDR